MWGWYPALLTSLYNKESRMGMSKDQMNAVAKGVFEKANDPYDQDAVLAEMFSAGIPFGKLKVIYRTVGITEGFIPDPVVLKESVIESLDNTDFDEIETWDELENVVENIASENKGATEVQIMRVLRSYCKESDIELPKKVKGGPRQRRRGGGALANVMSTYARETVAEAFSPRGFYDAILPVVKGPKNAFYYVTAFFDMVLAIKQAIPLEEANTLVKKMPTLHMKDVAPETE